MMPSSEERLVLTGMLGDVMRESAQAAVSYVWSNAEALDIDPKLFEGKTIHVHVPAGAIPKDGPSAGRDHRDGAGLARHPAAGAERRGHDGRDHPARQGASRRRDQGEGPGGAPGGHPLR